MGLFDFLRAPDPYHDPMLGALLYSGGRWRGTIELQAGSRAALFLPGSRGGPGSEALDVARHAADWWTRARPDVEKELFEHYSNGRDGGGADLPDIKMPSDVWSHVELVSVEIRPYKSVVEFQVAVRTAWDDEHTLGALVRGGMLTGLNGSILAPR